MKALTIGGAMIDTIAIIESDRIERMSMLNADTSFLLLEEGRKTEALEVSTHCGGGAVNTAVAMARLGFDVATLVKLGRDERADIILARLSAEGISTRWVIRDGKAPTGASVLVSSHDRNAAVFTFRGANTLLEPAIFVDEAFATDLVYVSSLSNRSADCYPTSSTRRSRTARSSPSTPACASSRRAAAPFSKALPNGRHPRHQSVGGRCAGAGLVAKFGEGGPTLALEAGRAAAGAAGARTRGRRL